MERKCLSFVLWLILLHSFISAVHCDCGSPLKIPYGVLKQEFADQINFAVASVVKYDCQIGFIRVPETKNDVTCLENSHWSSHDEFCQLIYCGFPGEIENGYLNAKSFSFGSRATYYCNLGFHMVSKRNYRECQADETWSNSLPSCEVIFACPEPKLLNGKVKEGKKTDGYSVGNSVTLECDSYYKLNGESKVTCGEDFRWYPQLPTCDLRTFCTEPKLINGRIIQGEKTNGYYESDSITVDCDSGYKLKGEKNMICQRNSQWSEFPVCERIVMCPPPPTIANGTFSPVKEEYAFSDAVRYKCTSPNMVTEYDSSVFCTDNGNWSDPIPRCIEVICEPPEIPHSRKILGFVGPYTLNSVMRFECNKGFAMKGADTIVCNMDSIWDPSPPECLEEGCSSPKIANGRITQKNGIRYDPEIDGHGFSTSDEVEIMCDSGYRLQGRSQSTCNKQRTLLYFTFEYVWLPKLPTCKYR